MNILDLAHEIGIHPKRVSNTKGGEYHSPCPVCEGKDRFIIWSEENKYWCRRCEVYGGTIKFCMAFLGLSYKDACTKLGETSVPRRRHCFNPKKHVFEPLKPCRPNDVWKRKALEFMESAHNRLHCDKQALELLTNRGLKETTIKKYKLGWNPICRWHNRLDWGLPSEKNESGREKKVWIPKGIVIPNQDMDKLKVRRYPWSEEDEYPKYVEIPGSRPGPLFFGFDARLPCLIVESELDALVVLQEAGDLCCCLALGGATKKADQETHEKLLKVPLLLFSLDFDQAGKERYMFWKGTYRNLMAWPVPRGKSPGDAFTEEGVDIRSWIYYGLRNKR